jgi:NAD-dependent dihydropyrimidine dehydrogenase PreA subunit
MIFYFSGTGNTRFVAKEIAAGIGEELLFIPDLIRENRYEFTLQPEETVGFCFPTHGWQPPRIVREFIKQLSIAQHPSPNNLYCWALTTCGDDMGEAMTILNKDLEAIGLKASTMFSVIMPESYVCLPFMYTDTEDKEQQKIAAAKEQLPHIIACLREHKEGIEELEKGSTPRLYSYVIGAYFNARMVHDKKFTVDADACIKCGKCAKMCPVDNITGTPPVWNHNGRCTSCLACYHYCPTHAINFGKITRKRGQYYFNKRGDQKS